MLAEFLNERLAEIADEKKMKVSASRSLGADMMHIVQAGTGDLSDWVELTEAVEALCTVWPMTKRIAGGLYWL